MDSRWSHMQSMEAPSAQCWYGWGWWGWSAALVEGCFWEVGFAELDSNQHAGCPPTMRHDILSPSNTCDTRRVRPRQHGRTNVGMPVTSLDGGRLYILPTWTHERDSNTTQTPHTPTPSMRDWTCAWGLREWPANVSAERS